MAIKIPKGTGSKLGRTETVSIRLDPRLNYLCELAARVQRRTKSSFIEATLAAHIWEQKINTWQRVSEEDSTTFGDLASILWHVRESQRLVSLGIIAPELMTFEEQQIWALIEENPYFWHGQNNEGRWEYSADLDSVIRARVDDHWDDLIAVAIGSKPAEILPKPKPDGCTKPTGMDESNG